MGIMLVYDITNAKSFENISKWLRNIDEVKKTHTNTPYSKILSEMQSEFLSILELSVGIPSSVVTSLV